MGFLRRLAPKPAGWPIRLRRPGAIARDWPLAGLQPGISWAPASARIPASGRPVSWVEYPLDLDIGEVADGYHLIFRRISLSAKDLFCEFAFAPELAEDAEVWPNLCYTADIPVSQDYIGAGHDLQYGRPPRKARYAWFDFFRTDYEWLGHFHENGQPDDDYLRNRVARLTFDLTTGQTSLEN